MGPKSSYINDFKVYFGDQVINFGDTIQEVIFDESDQYYYDNPYNIIENGQVVGQIVPSDNKIILYESEYKVE